MRFMLRLRRRRGVLIPPDQFPIASWTLGHLATGGEYLRPKKALVFVAESRVPGTGVIAELLRPTIADVRGDQLVLRGFERVALEDGRITVVMQDWCSRPRPEFGGMGRRAPEHRQIREHLDQPEPPPW